MLQHPDYTRNRLRQLGERLCRRIYPQIEAVTELLVSPRVDRISHEEAQKLTYRPAALGEQFGPAWATYWFKIKAVVPMEWKGRRVDLQWISHSEAMLWINGQMVQGLNFEPPVLDRSARSDAILVREARGGETIEINIEMACNRLMGLSSGHNLKTVSPHVLDQCHIAAFDPEAWDLYFDFAVLQQVEAESTNPGRVSRSWAGELLSELNRFANLYDENDRATWSEGGKILKELYKRTNGTRTLEVTAIGHGHIDTAWLWPLAETWRKCERTFASQLAFMEDYEDFTFACSQAAQYQVIKERNAVLYDRIKARVKTGQWVPVGGTWIEPDCNIPSGESLARQFLFGQRFFEKEFGIRCREFWNPDVFGYNGQLPQIMRLCGIDRFLTQKLSWNRFNKPPHHTFTWQGIDGSEVFTHFPPSDNYNSLTPYDGKSEVAWLMLNAENYKDHDRSKHCIMLYGHGDGGGGPTRRMIEILRRAADLQDVPRTKMRGSNEFFDLLGADCTDRTTMVGELYFEYHRGTYTTQAAVKKGNRKGEFLLHDIEFLATCAHRLGRMEYPKEELDRLWRLLLLNQFHDILPGSSITLVYDDAARDFAEIQRAGEKLRSEVARALFGGGEGNAPIAINTVGFCRAEVVAQPDGTLTFVEAAPYGVAKSASTEETVRVTVGKDVVVLENARLRAEFRRDGSLTGLIEKGSGREAMRAPGNRFEIYDDHPTEFDAWDIDPFHLETREDCPVAETCEVVRQDPLRAEVRFSRAISPTSRITQTIRLEAGACRLEFHTEIDWDESHKMLKVAFPVNVRALNATYEMQFGHVERPTHYSTPYDLAKYEVPGHKWVDFGEHGFGVALLTESKYGFSTFGETMRLSLLRAPKDPDPRADIGKHHFVYALMPHADGWRQAGVVAESYRFNVPFVWAHGAGANYESFASCDDPNLVVDTIKRAEDSDAIIVRLYECHGARGTARLHCALPFQSVCQCDILEQEGESVVQSADGMIDVIYRPFQIITLKLQ